LVDEVLASLAEERELSGLQPVEKLAANMACRAAVRFGDRLPESELKALVEWWRAHPLLRNCPHGRPVAAVLTLSDLELQFLRKK
jgi:DNA mismatch repair protein MutL